jgi:O-antigen/teichoic acid export membrane protein
MSARTLQAMTLGGIAVALVMWAAAEPIVVLLGGDEYEPAATVLQIQSIAAITVFIAAALQLPLFGMGQVRLTARAFAAGIVVVIAAGCALIPGEDATGAALAFLIGDITVCAGLYIGLRRPMRQRWVPLADMGRVLAAAAVGVGGLLLPIGSDIVQAVVALAAFLIAALGLRAIPSEVIDTARGALARLR